MTEENLKKAFQKGLPSQSPACHNKLDAFFTQWWDTPYTGSAAAGNKPQITGPGLAGGGFYDATGGCAPYGVDVPGDAGGTVTPTLSLTLGVPAAFGTFTPALAKDYTASTTANVISTAGGAALSISDPGSTAPGHLVNGAFSLPAALKVSAASPTGVSSGSAPIGGSPLTLLSYGGPVSNDPATISFVQPIGSTDPLRTGSYSKTLTLTLSTTTP
jgi:hypothetical protein